MNARDAILLALGSDPERHPNSLKRLNPKAPSFMRPDPWRAFNHELEALGGRLVRVENTIQAKTALAALIRVHKIRSMAAWDHPLLEAIELEHVLETEGVELIRPGDADFVQRAALADVGVTAADALLLESGSVVLHSDANMPASASLLPPVHLAVVRPGQTLPDVLGLPGLIRQIAARQGRMPRAFHAISGPSATADIEEIRVMGAHGPTRLVILAVTGLD